ncbi:MAG: hypothetical protein U0359_19465 [Byssovorax sp.]
MRHQLTSWSLPSASTMLEKAPAKPSCGMIFTDQVCLSAPTEPTA